MDGGLNAEVHIGQRGDGAGTFYTGYIQEVAGFQNLSPAQLCVHYAGGVTAPSLWPFTVKAPTLPRFRNDGYFAKLVRDGYNSGLLSIHAKQPQWLTFPWLPFGLLPPGNAR
jgi:hypothetical protein